MQWLLGKTAVCLVASGDSQRKDLLVVNAATFMALETSMLRPGVRSEMNGQAGVRGKEALALLPLSADSWLLPGFCSRDRWKVMQLPPAVLETIR